MKVCFLAANNSTWVKLDQEILSQKHDVVSFIVSDFKSLSHSLLGVLSSEFIFCWFASFRFLPHILLGKILGLPIIIAVGGYEVARLDSIGYGSMNRHVSLISRLIRKVMIRLADKVLAVSQSSQSQIIKEIGNIKNSQIRKISLAANTPEIEIPGFLQRKKQAILFANVEDQVSYDVKGIDILIDLAQIMPDYQFLLIGKYKRQIFPSLLPKNFILAGWVENMSEPFIQLGRESRFVLQSSRHESFGMSLVEMTCFGAFPMGSNAYALSETIATLGGKNIESNKAIDYKVEIEKIESVIPDVVKLARQAKITFSVQAREIEMWDILSSLNLAKNNIVNK